MTQDQILLYRLEQAEKHLEENDQKIKDLERQIEEQEKQRFKWGIGALGTVVSVLLTIIWGYRGDIFR